MVHEGLTPLSLLAWLALAVGPAVALADGGRQESSAPPALEAGPLTVRMFRPERVALSEVIEIGIVLSAPHRVRLHGLQVHKPPETCSVLALALESSDVVEGELARYRLQKWTLRLEPLRLGRTELGELLVDYEDGSKAKETASIPLGWVEVVQGPSSSSDPATLRPLPDLPTRSPEPNRFLGRRAVVLVLLSAALILAICRRRKAPALTAAHRALAKLRPYEDSDLVLRGEYRAFIEQVSQLLREYLEAAHGLAAPRQTTPELLSKLQTAGLSEDRRALLAVFLAEVDVEKFAGTEPDNADCRRCLEKARRFLASELYSQRPAVSPAPRSQKRNLGLPDSPTRDVS